MDYWMEISSDRDFLGPARLMFLFETLMDHWTINVPHLLAQYLFRHAKGRKSGARLSGGHFIGRLAMHFGLVSNEGLRGLQVAQGPERQQAATASASKAGEDGQGAKEVAPEIPAPALMQAPPPPSPTPQPRTMS
ncbi:hypothetical protein Tco_1009614 [Tanacetum coccineum]